MKILRPSSYDEFVEWYLHREERRGKLGREGIPSTLAERRKFISEAHAGKVLPWFKQAAWHVVELERIDEVGSLICLESDWTRRSCLIDEQSVPNYRILKTFSIKAKDHNYFGSQDQLGIDDQEYRKRQQYITRFRNDWPILRDGDRIVLRSTVQNEQSKNPDGTYYLHDGLGRLLPYFFLIRYEGRNYCPVEAFLAEEQKVGTGEFR